VPALDPARLKRLTHAWTWRRAQEHVAVGAFCELAHGASLHGCEPAILALLTRAATDEVHHADVCRRLVEKHTGRSLDVVLRASSTSVAAPSESSFANVATETSERTLLLRIVETCCISETLTGAYFTEMLELATQPLGRAVVLALLEDEIDHGRVGWAYLASACRNGRAFDISSSLASMIERNVAPIFDAALRLPEPDDEELDRHGYMGRTRAADVYRHAIGTILLPGFEALDLDTRDAHELVRARGWA
jgi:hypothetical protein